MYHWIQEFCCYTQFIGSMEAPSKVFLLFSCSLIGLSWIISKVEWNVVFQTFFIPYLFDRSRNNRCYKQPSKFWHEEMFRKPHLKLLRWFLVDWTNNNGSRPDFQVHITRKHINTFSNAVINVTWCVTESFLIKFDVFPNVYSVVYNVLKVIQKRFLGSDCTRHLSYSPRSCRCLRM